MMICIDCGTRKMINKDCLNHRVVEIDSLICDAIIKLNQKGYKTFTCCSGHNTRKSFYGYICFDKRIPKKYGKPKGWEFDNILLANEEQGQWKQSKRTIRYFMEDDEDKKSKIKLMMKNLNEWVDGLPYLKG